MSRPRAIGFAAGLAAGLALAAGTARAAKPTPPVALSVHILRIDPTAGTAAVEIAVRPLVRAGSVSLACDLPPGAAAVPGTGSWSRRPDGTRVLRLRIVLPPKGGKLVVRVDVRGPGLHTGRIAGVPLPPPAGPGRPPVTGPKPRIIQTSKGQRLRVHP